MNYKAPIALSRVPIHRHRYFVLFILWLALTLLNLNKAFHIDDTFHLKAAAWIGLHPFFPMSGMINWDNVPEPLYNFNQPPLFFYLIAGFTKLLGTGEIPLHLFLSVFTFLALLSFQKIAELLQLKNTNFLLFLLAFNPAFLVNQNLMTDVPVLSITLGFTYFILKAGTSNARGNYALAAVLLGAGLLIKYSLLPLLIVLLIITLIRQHYKYAAVTLIPCVMLIIWSAWNYQEYGAIHLLDRPRDPFQIKHLWDFINCLGAISVFSIPLVYGLFPSRLLRTGIVSIVFIWLLLMGYVLVHKNVQELYANYLILAFTVNGCLIIGSLLLLLSRWVKKITLKQAITSNYFVIFLTAVALSSFLILLAPFMATRHLLLVIPFLLILGSDLIRKTEGLIFQISFVLTLFFGLLLGISDWYYADYYRNMAAKLPQAKNGTMWYAGHWGWQWYAEKNGMKQYTIQEKALKNGDYLAYPGDISIQSINKSELQLIEKKWEKASPFNWFSVSFASLYSSGIDKAVWKLSSQPLDTVYLYRVVKTTP